MGQTKELYIACIVITSVPLNQLKRLKPCLLVIEMMLSMCRGSRHQGPFLPLLKVTINISCCSIAKLNYMLTICSAPDHSQLYVNEYLANIEQYLRQNLEASCATIPN